MISKTVKTTGGFLKITIPSTRDEITLGMLDALTPKPGHSFSAIDQLSILSGIPIAPEADGVIGLYDAYNIEDYSVFDETLQTLAYQISAFKEVQEIPETIVLPMEQSHTQRWFKANRFHVGKVIPVMKNLGIQPAGAYMEAKERIKDEYTEWERIKRRYGDDIEFNPSIASYIRILALYFHGPATGEKFNTVKATEFEEVIRKLSITKALPIARYFFLSYPNLSKPKETPSLESLKRLIRKQA